jgi:hypothetical protein
MKAGTEVKCVTDQDMIEFTRWIQKRGGEVFCKDYELKVIKVIRGTQDEEKVELFNVDGVLGVVNVSDTCTGKAE